MNTTEKTLQYYNTHAESFVRETIYVPFSQLQEEFLSKIKSGGRILDLGCGSGRDSKYFLSQGYRVVAVDGSERLCELASQYIGQQVICSTFQDYEPEGLFDGIWACSSLLHLEANDIVKVIRKLSDSLIESGYIYLSFKYGTFCGERNGRFFTDMNENTFLNMSQDFSRLSVERLYITKDSRLNKQENKWLNILLTKDYYKNKRRDTNE